MNAVGMHLWFAPLDGKNDSLMVLTHHKDIAEAARRAEKVVKSKRSEYYGCTIKTLEYQGIIDAAPQ